MPALLARLVGEVLPKGATMSRARRNGEPDAAEVGRANLAKKESPGPPSALTCPECGGALWEKKDGIVWRYECHVGHSYTMDTLSSEKHEELESVLWSALRALEESADLRRRMARRAEGGPSSLRQMKDRYEKQAREAEDRAAVLRTVLTNGGKVQKMASMTSRETKAKRSRTQSVEQAHKGGDGRNGNGRHGKSRNTRRRKTVSSH